MTFHRLCTASVVTLLALLISVICVPDAAQAAAPSNPANDVSWSVEPSSETGATGQAWMELTLDAGQSVTEYMLITNRGATDITFHLSAADGYFTATGRFNMLRADEQSVDAGTWITLPNTAEIAAGKSIIVPFHIEVPANATPGDHAAGVAAGIRTGDDTIGVESRVGFRVMTRIRGDLTPALTITDRTAVYAPSWNPFLPGSLTVTATVVNSGNTRLGAVPYVASVGPLGTFAASTTLGGLSEFAPGESRTITAHIADVWPSFVTTVHTRATPVTVDQTGPVPAATADIVVATVPWSHMALALLFASAAALLTWRNRARRKALARMIEDAREEGRRQSAATNAGLVVLLISAMASGLILAHPSPSFADERLGAISVDVEIAPTESVSTPSPTPVATFSPSPTHVDGPADGGLALTGMLWNPVLFVGALALIVGGAAIITLCRSSRK
ncbi:MAG: hypothetical protein PIR02_12405 [Microbacterium enclense]